MATRLVGAREANQQFSALIKGVEDDGDVVIITRRGQPIVRIERVAKQRDAREVARAMDAIFATHSRAIGTGPLDREALHERDVKMLRR